MPLASQVQAPTVQQYSAYNEAFDFFNKRLFASKLGPALLTIARQGRSKGYFTPNKWANQAGESVHEIAISPDVLTLGAEATMTTLIALMARQQRWQEAAAADDEKAAATAARGYHDARLVEILLELGLLPTAKDGKPARGGWNLAAVVVTDTPADDAMDALPNKARLPWEAVIEAPADGPEARRKTGRIKYTCPTCESHVLGRPGLSVYCTGDEGEHPRLRMVGEDEPTNDAEEVGAAPVEEDVVPADDTLDEPDEQDGPVQRPKEVVEPEQESVPVVQETHPAVESLPVEWRKGGQHAPTWNYPLIGGTEVEGIAIEQIGTTRWRLFGPKVVQAVGEDHLDFETFRSAQVVGERLLRGEPHGSMILANAQGRRTPDPHTAAATPYLEQLDRWADAVMRAEDLAWSDLAKIEARWGAAQRAIHRHRSRWVGKEMQVRVGEGYVLGFDPGGHEERRITVPEGTRVRVKAVTATVWNQDKIRSVIVGGKNDGHEVTLPPSRLREVPPEGVPTAATPVAGQSQDGEVEGTLLYDEEAESGAEKEGEEPPEWDADWKEPAPAGWAWLVTNGDNKPSTIHTYHLLGDYKRPACGARLECLQTTLGTWEEITCRKCQRLHAPAADLSRSSDPSLRGAFRLWKDHRNSREVHIEGGCHLPLHQNPLRWIGEASEVTCERCQRKRDEIPARRHEAEATNAKLKGENET